MHAVILSPRDHRGGISDYSLRLGQATNVGVHSYCIKNVKGKDIVHVQFEYNVREFAPFGLTVILYLMMLRLLRKKIVFTLHYVYSIQDFTNSISTPHYRYHPFVIGLAKLYIYSLTRIVCSLAHAIIVLNTAAKQILENEYGVQRKVFYVEFCSYGLREKDLIPREEAKNKLGLGGKRVLFSFGTLHPRKQYEIVISLLPKLKRKYPNIMYVISKSLPSSSPRKGRKYLERIIDLAHELDVNRNVTLVNYIPENKLKYHFRASDIVIFPQRGGAYGSGASKYALRFLSRMIVSDVPCFESLEDCVHCFKFGSKDDLFQKIVKAFEEEPNFENGLRRKIEELDIERHARMHFDIYKKVL